MAVQSEAERFWAKVDRAGDGCWLWLADLNAGGYGTFRRGTRMVLAHRLAFELEAGPIPDGLTLDHLCGRPECVRPAHLEPVTAAENLRRRHARSRAAASVAGT
jgi:hypothetical protein